MQFTGGDDVNAIASASGQLKTLPLARPRVAVICDFKEENWPSMDLVGDMLCDHLSSNDKQVVDVTRIRPPMPQPFGRRSGTLNNFHRILGRFVSYPRELRVLRAGFDLFHIVDHSYAHLALELPPGRVVVTCHDVDAFRDLVPGARSRNLVRSAMSRHILSGLRRAAWITCDTHATRDQLLSNHLAQADRVSVVHNGVDPAFCPHPNESADTALANMLGRRAGESPEVLHVGSTIARKRIQDVLGIFAKLRARIPTLRLLRVGGVFTGEQHRITRKLDLTSSIDVLPRLDRSLLAAVYRRARVVIQPSEAEGFGLPIVEAMASGTPVVASDIPALREVGGTAAEYCPVGDVEAWSRKLFELMNEAEYERRGRREACLQQASRFKWNEYAHQMTDIYQRIVAW